jgi:hypothetical protein
MKKLYRDDAVTTEDACGWSAGAVRRRRRRLRHRWPGPDAPDLPGGARRHRRGRRHGMPDDEVAAIADTHRGRTSDPPLTVPQANATGPGEPGSHHEHAVLCLARAVDEGQGRLRPQGHRPRALGGGRAVRRRDPVRLREPLPACTRSRRSTTGSPSPPSASYNEFENLRVAGVRLADMRGYAYDRRDVTGRGLANAYAQTLGTIFSEAGRSPTRSRLFVAEVGDERGA